jgi:hypothetical protein
MERNLHNFTLTSQQIISKSLAYQKLSFHSSLPEISNYHTSLADVTALTDEAA